MFVCLFVRMLFIFARVASSCKTYDNGKPMVWPKSLHTFLGVCLLKDSG